MVKFWILSLLLRLSSCTEDKRQCEHENCISEIRGLYPSRYTTQANEINGQESHGSLGTTRNTQREDEVDIPDVDIDTSKTNENEINVANSLSGNSELLVGADMEELASTHSQPQGPRLDLITNSAEGRCTTSAKDPPRSSISETFEFPPVYRLAPGSVGDVVQLHLEPGMVHKRITRATAPPIFEVPNFLSFEECDMVIQKAKENKMQSSGLFGAEESHADKNSSEISRISRNAWITKAIIGPEFWKELQERLSRLTGVPVGVIERAEPLQVVNYGPAGHYHAHVDSQNNTNVPCCFQTSCGNKEYTLQWAHCCRLCRFVTVMFYLNDVTHGGETAFPLADMPDDLFQAKMKDPKKTWQNLSHYCHNSSVVVSPRKGTAVMWYNHFVDEKGYLGPVDLRSNHGGCDIIKGEKWIATSWISEKTYDQRFEESTFFDGK